MSAAQEQLAPVDARAAVEAFEARLNCLRAAAAPKNRDANTPNLREEPTKPVSVEGTVIGKPVRERDRDHLRFVASRGCLICRRSPSDAITSNLA